MANSDGSPHSGTGTHKLETSEVGVGGGIGGHVPCFERVLRIGRHPHRVGRGPLTRDFESRSSTEVQSGDRDNHPIISHLTASVWFRGMDLTITSSTSKKRVPSNEKKNVAAAEKQLEAMAYRLTQERGRWPFLTPRLQNATDKTRENAPPLLRQIWEFLEGQLEMAESRG